MYADKREAILRCLAERDNIMIRPKKYIGEQIRAAAKRSGKTISAYILEAVRVRMLQDGFPMGE